MRLHVGVGERCTHVVADAFARGHICQVVVVGGRIV